MIGMWLHRSVFSDVSTGSSFLHMNAQLLDSIELLLFPGNMAAIMIRQDTYMMEVRHGASGTIQAAQARFEAETTPDHDWTTTVGVRFK